MEEMANAAETIEKLAREAERLQLLEVARGCKDLDEFIKKLETAIKSQLKKRDSGPPSKKASYPNPERLAGSLTPATLIVTK